jgi:hypothetical protein
MANSLFEKATDLSLLEKLQTTNYALLLLNFGLYLITVLPLMKQFSLPAVDSSWGDMSLPCSVQHTRQTDFHYFYIRGLSR